MKKYGQPLVDAADALGWVSGVGGAWSGYTAVCPCCTPPSQPPIKNCRPPAPAPAKQAFCLAYVPVDAGEEPVGPTLTLHPPKAAADRTGTIVPAGGELRG